MTPQDPRPERRELRARVSRDVPLEERHQVEEEADQPEGGFRPVEELQAEPPGPEGAREFFDPALALGATVGAAPDGLVREGQAGDHSMDHVPGDLHKVLPASRGLLRNPVPHDYQSVGGGPPRVWEAVSAPVRPEPKGRPEGRPTTT
jgi:hypothetical protein